MPVCIKNMMHKKSVNSTGITKITEKDFEGLHAHHINDFIDRAK